MHCSGSTRIKGHLVSTHSDRRPRNDDSRATAREPVLWQSVWRVIAGLLATGAALWAVNELQQLIGMLVVAFFFSLALEPLVRWVQGRTSRSRPATVGIVFLCFTVFLVGMVLILIPAITELARSIGERSAGWAESISEWATEMGVGDGVATGAIEDGVSDLAAFVEAWATSYIGTFLGIASTGIGLVFTLATIAMFTFYLTADSPRLTRLVLSWFPPERQTRLGWTLDQAVVQTGGYFYSRSILMLINGAGFFFVMVLVGMPTSFALPLAAFGGFVSVFIPTVGTYIGAAIPILVTLGVQGLTAALVLLGYVLIYQQVENLWLSPRISSQTMELNPAVAFGAAIAGGSLAGAMGAFMALPVAALVMSFAQHYGTSYDVVYESESTREPVTGDAAE